MTHDSAGIPDTVHITTANGRQYTLRHLPLRPNKPISPLMWTVTHTLPDFTSHQEDGWTSTTLEGAVIIAEADSLDCSLEEPDLVLAGTTGMLHRAARVSGFPVSTRPALKTGCGLPTAGMTRVRHPFGPRRRCNRCWPTETGPW